MALLPALGSNGTIILASTASLISREAVALFFFSIPNRSRTEAFVRLSLLT